MVSRKYLNDYRVEEKTDTNGKVRSEAVYIGGDYILSPSVTAGDKRLILCMCALSWAAFVCALLPATSVARIPYVMFPFIFSALPLYLTSSAAVSLLGAQETMTRERSDKISKRLPPGALFTAILPGAAFVALPVSVAVTGNGIVAGDFIFAALLLVICFASALIFRKSRKIKAVKV